MQYVPASAASFDLLTLKLEFYLNVYFAIYPVLPSSAGAAARMHQLRRCEHARCLPACFANTACARLCTPVLCG
eukprot:361107-Chlamydomonas_euryale.AAC.2